MIGRNRSVSKTESWPWRMGRIRSRPAPVSMFLRGSSVSVPAASRLSCMKTRFQISTKRWSPPCLGPPSCAVRLPLVEEDLRVGPAGPGVAHGPEVVLVAHALDPLGAQADRVDPDLLGLVVALVHGDPEAVAVEAEDLGQELPGHRDGLRLEVVPEAEVAQHLEEGAVVGVGADDVDVGGPEALLDGGGPGPGRRLLAQEVGLEGHHAGDGEEDRGVVRDQAGRGDERVAPVGEVAREGRPQSVGVHRSSLPGAKTAARPGGRLRPTTCPRSACSGGCCPSTRRSRRRRS